MPRILISDTDLKRGERVEKIRKERKLTRNDFGKLAGGFPQGTVYTWEKKGNGIPNVALVSLLRAGVDIVWLLTGKKAKVLEEESDE